jgi:hypothetical protein
MNRKLRKTLKAIFMEWREIESLLVAIGCRVLEGNGYPDKAAFRYRVKDTRNLLTELRVKP